MVTYMAPMTYRRAGPEERTLLPRADRKLPCTSELPS